ncbi:TPA: hypothetical protein DD449_04025 [Candidatus Berkelbacteria bacterium]|nr:hypothetical protein [Candidatus Berkelbacteria bacterium]
MEEFKTLKQIVEHFSSRHYIEIKAPDTGFELLSLKDDSAFIKLKELAEREQKKIIPLKIKLRFDVVFDLFRHGEKIRCVGRAGLLGNYNFLDCDYCFKTENGDSIYFDKDFVSFHSEMFEAA